MTSDSEQDRIMREGLRRITLFVDLYAIVNRDYLGREEGAKRPTEPSDIDGKKLLRDQLVYFYRQILHFLARAVRYFSHNIVKRALGNMVTSDDWAELLKSLEKLHVNCLDVMKRDDPQTQ